MKKAGNSKALYTGKGINITISEDLSNLKPSRYALKKLEEANKILRELKTPLPQ